MTLILTPNTELLLPSRQKITYNVGWVERSETQRYAGFRPSTSAYNFSVI